MFSSLYIQNFKSFSSLDVNFLKTKTNPKHAVVIYGENGAGKSNLCRAFEFLKDSIRTLEYTRVYSDYALPQDLQKEFEKDNGQLERIFFSGRRYSFERMMHQNRMIGEDDPTVLKYNFVLKGVEGYYEIIYDDDGLSEETLYYRMEKSRGKFFKISRDHIKDKLSQKIFKTEALRKSLQSLIEQYWGKHTLMAILQDEFKQKNMSYFRQKIHPNFFVVHDFFIDYISSNVDYSINVEELFSTPLGFEINGRIRKSNREDLDHHEKVLQQILPNIFSDVKNVYYDLKETENKNYLDYQLYFEKWIEGRLRKISVRQESNGTKKVLNLLMPLIEAHLGRTVIIDEADTGIHDSLFNELISKAIDGAKGQLIITTHNTLLLNELPTDAVYLLRVDANGRRTLDSLPSLERIYPHHNVRERYLNGVYGGVPYIGYIDFKEIEDCLEDEQ